jgi:IstB-like ATP binding protein
MASGPLDIHRSINSYDAELRRLIRVDLLILDDFALTALDAIETADVYEIVVERHRRASTIVTSNRAPAEWLAAIADPLLAQSAVDRLQSAAYELVLEGESYRGRLQPRRAVAHGQRAGRWSVRRRAERVSRPARLNSRRRSVFVVRIPHPTRGAPSSARGCAP